MARSGDHPSQDVHQDGVRNLDLTCARFGVFRGDDEQTFHDATSLREFAPHAEATERIVAGSMAFLIIRSDATRAIRPALTLRAPSRY